MTASESNIQKKEQVNYRRYKDKVIICGMGVIIFGIWSVIKTYMMFLFSINELYVDGTAPETTEEKIFALIFVTVFSVLVFSLHFYVGITAMKEAADPKNKKIFLFLGGLLFILALISSKRNGGAWKLKFFHGLLNLAIVILCVTFFNRPETAVYVYASGLVYSAILRVITAFRRTAVVSIQ